MLHGLLLDVKGEFFIDVRQKEGQVSDVFSQDSYGDVDVMLLLGCVGKAPRD